MGKFVTFTSRVVPLLANNIDTDQIIPARFLKVTDKKGLGDNLFYDWRYLPDGSPNPDFILNRPQTAGVQILLAGDNFGCGSSREHAPWALTGFGFKVVISTSFADIFKNNALKNGLLPIVVEPEIHQQLCNLVEINGALQLSIDLASQTVTLPGGTKFSFPIDEFSKTCLLNGVDELGYILRFEKAIKEYENNHNGK
ncbi:MAG: 3-isopropylmalate dehydratase small subunit [Bacteroidota bacterium]